MILGHISEPVKNAVDTAAVFGAVATLFDVLPSIAAVLSIIWLGLRIAIAILEHKVKRQEHALNKRKLAAQDVNLKTYRQHLESTLKEGVPPDIQRLLDSLK